jgi:two-component system, response regulator
MNNYNEIEILIIEDNPNDAEMALRALKKNNVKNNVLVIDDGEDAMDYIFARGKFLSRNPHLRPKLILLDLKLPKVSGLQILKALKENAETRLTPVVVLTSSKQESDLIESYHLGVNSYIVKPVDFDNFVEAVRELGFYWLLLNKVPD